MKQEIYELLDRAKEAINQCDSVEAYERVRIEFLGKKGELTGILKGMGRLSAEERPVMGKISNEVREEIERLLEAGFQKEKKALKDAQLKEEVIDVTIQGKSKQLGSRHPITITIEEITRIFIGMGYKIAEGPEVETVANTFDALNAPKDHPSRDRTDTFYVSEDVVLRTQTSPVQVRTIRKEPLPIKVISPGRCFRCDTPDATHAPMFHQIEGILVDEGVSMADLKGTLDHFVKAFFGTHIKTKFRPHHFPFTEPSAEVDVTCFKCGGSGCRVCKGTGWIEILGCGMVHPNVLKEGNIDTEKYTGFAFGMGVERIAMLKYGIDDIRLLYENDVRFLEQFK